MKKHIKFVILGCLLLVTSLGVVYATVTVASSRKSQKLPWQGTPSGHYDPAHNVGGSNAAQSRFSFVSGSTPGATSVVKDSVTGLMWESQGSNGENTTTMNWTSAKTRCTDLVKGGYPQGTWRLPNIKELASIMDYSRHSPADTTYFSLASSSYWSSTTYAGNTSYALYLNFSNAQPSFNVKTTNHYVVCVRSD